MPLEPGPLAEHAAYVIDEIEKEYGVDAELRDAVIVTEIRTWDDGPGDAPSSTVEVFHMGKRNTTAIEILTRGLDACRIPSDE